MCPTGSKPSLRLVAPFLAVLLVACTTPGYRVRIETQGCGRFNDRLWTGLEDLAKAQHFSIVAERSNSRVTSGFSSQYTKRLSSEWHDEIALNLYWDNNNGGRIAVVIENQLRGIEIPVKTQIDTLGDQFHDLLSEYVGKDKIADQRAPTSIPLLH